MKRRLVMWVGRHLVSALGKRVGRAAGTRGRSAGIGRDLIEIALLRVWPMIDTPAVRERGGRFVSRMRASAAASKV